MKKLLCAVVAVVLVSASTPRTSYAQQAQPSDGFAALAEIAAVIQALTNFINAIMALGGGFGGTPVMDPTQPPPMPPPPMDPIDPNMFMPPPFTPPPPGLGCEILLFERIDLGDAYFLPEGQVDRRFPFIPVRYPGPVFVDAIQESNPTCAEPGIRIRVFRAPVTPLQFTDVPPITVKAIPPPDGQTSIGLMASDTKQIGFCRPGFLFEVGAGETCIAAGVVNFVYAEAPRDPLPPAPTPGDPQPPPPPTPVSMGGNMGGGGMDGTAVWPTRVGIDAFTTVTLDIFTPTQAFLD